MRCRTLCFLAVLVGLVAPVMSNAAVPGELPSAGTTGIPGQPPSAGTAAGSGKIVFHRNARAWTVSASGGRAHRLPPRNVGTGVRYSYDGRHLLWGTFPDQHCYAADADGHHARRLSTPRMLKSYLGCPVPSPSARVIAFKRTASPPPGFDEDEVFQQLFLADRRLRHVRRLRTPMSATELAWSPNGRRLAVIGISGSERGALWIVPRSGTPTEIVSSENEGASSPDWSPDGRLIAFSRSTFVHGDLLHQIWTVRPDGTQLRQVTHLPAGADTPSWSPNGRRIAIHTGRSVATISRDGTGLRRLARGFAPDWAP